MSENPETPFLLYAGEDERVHVNVLVHAETIWLPLAQLAERFTVDKSGISRLLKNIYETGELSQEATVANFATVQIEGGRDRAVKQMQLLAVKSVTAKKAGKKKAVELAANVEDVAALEHVEQDLKKRTNAAKNLKSKK